MKMKNNILILTSLLLLMSCQVETVEFYVATDGSDSDKGTIDAPFATITHARNTVREKIAGGYKGNIIDATTLFRERYEENQLPEGIEITTNSFGLPEINLK